MGFFILNFLINDNCIKISDNFRLGWFRIGKVVLPMLSVKIAKNTVNVFLTPRMLSNCFKIVFKCSWLQIMNDIFGLIFILKLLFVPWGHQWKRDASHLKEKCFKSFSWKIFQVKKQLSLVFLVQFCFEFIYMTRNMTIIISANCW